jgi:regulator of sigma E protease
VTATVEHVPVDLLEAIGRSFSFIVLVAQMIISLFNPATAGAILGQSSSIVGISVEASAAASMGFLPFITLAAALSISIGLMNLLPLPPLDGGKIVLETIQRLTRRLIPMRVINSVSLFALVLLGMVFIFVTWQDIQRYILAGFM